MDKLLKYITKSNNKWWECPAFIISCCFSTNAKLTEVKIDSSIV